MRQRVCDEQHVQEHEARRVIGLAEDGRGDADGGDAERVAGRRNADDHAASVAGVVDEVGAVPTQQALAEHAPVTG